MVDPLVPRPAKASGKPFDAAWSEIAANFGNDENFTFTLTGHAGVVANIQSGSTWSSRQRAAGKLMTYRDST